MEERVVMIKSKSLGYRVSITGVMAALTTVMTMIISIYIPASEGFFNIGESMVYLSAILFGPFIGGLSGGIGSFLADIFLGYANYALGTLIIKGIEGYLVGIIYSKLRNVIKTKKVKNILITVLGLITSLSIFGIGMLFYVGQVEFSGFKYLWVFNVNISWVIWLVISVISFIGIIYIERKTDLNTSSATIAMLIGGVEMVLGYLTYATFILSNPIAYVEVPFNMMQCVIGIIISIPLISSLRKIIK
ncbi:MAG: ECF transporter S component [Promethearchaeota archaeon]